MTATDTLLTDQTRMAGRARITITRRYIAGADQYRVETTVGGFVQPEHCRTLATLPEAEGYAAVYAATYEPVPDSPAELAPVVPVLRTGHVAALANLRFAGWTVKAIAAELKVSTRSVYKWLAGSNPSPARREALTALNYGLRSTGAGCGCGGVGWIHTGESWTGGRLAPTYVRCSCNKERETDA